MTRLKTWFKKRWDWLKKNWDYTIAPIVVVVAVVVNNWNRGWFNALEGIDIVLIVAILLFFMGYLYILLRIIPTLEFVGGRVGKRNIQVFGTLLGSLVVFYLLWNLHGILPNKWVEISLLAGLVAVTSGLAVYAAAQAYASVKMAEEMREQRIMTSRPVMIQKAMPTIIDGTTTDIFSHFEVYNAGNGPAIELQVSLLDKEKRPISVLRETSVTAGESPIRPSAIRQAFPFELANLPESTYYIVCEYQSIFSRLSKKQTWYQTWLPFQRCKSSQGGVRVEPGELEFKEITEKERINAFGKLKSMQREKPE